MKSLKFQKLIMAIFDFLCFNIYINIKFKIFSKINFWNFFKINNNRKEFTFDLKIKELKKYFGANNYSKGYEELFEFFCKDRNLKEHLVRNSY